MFLQGRSWLREWTRRRLASSPKLLAIEQAVSREGLKLVVLTRLSPAFPFSLLNLAYSLNEVSLRDYSIGLIGILPGTVFFCFLGAAAGDPRRFSALLSGPADGLTLAARLIGVGATVALMLLVNHKVRRALEDRGLTSRRAMQPRRRRLPQRRRRAARRGAAGVGEQDPGGG